MLRGDRLKRRVVRRSQCHSICRPIWKIGASSLPIDNHSRSTNWRNISVAGLPESRRDTYRRERRQRRRSGRTRAGSRRRFPAVRSGRDSGQRCLAWRRPGRGCPVRFAYLPLPTRRPVYALGGVRVRYRPIVPIHWPRRVPIERAWRHKLLGDGNTRSVRRPACGLAVSWIRPFADLGS
jgi:hypothetical protein